MAREPCGGGCSTTIGYALGKREGRCGSACKKKARGSRERRRVELFLAPSAHPRIMIDHPTSTQTPPPAASGANGDSLTLTLPDGSTRTVARGTLPADVVRSIGERRAQAAVAVEVDGRIQDLATPLRAGGSFRVLTDRDPSSLPVLRHSAAHMLATAGR